MEALVKKIKKSGGKMTFRRCSLFFSLMVLLTMNVFGDTASAEKSLPATNDAATNDTAHSRQVWNGTNWVDSSQESDSAALAEAQKKADHDTFMTYFYMTLGFLAILAIAWFTRGKEKKGEKETTVAPAVKHPHSSVDKKYGGHKPRR